MAFFLYRAAVLSERYLGRKCGEFVLGRQDGLTDTMGDLAFGMFGAGLCLVAVARNRGQTPILR